MASNGILKIKGLIKDFAVWDDTINLHVIKFYAKYNVYPNILEASELTFRKIELNAQRHVDRIVASDTGEKLGESSLSYNGISVFVAANYELNFCLDIKLGEGSFRLIYDEAPDFGGEPIDEVQDEEPDRLIVYKISA